MRRLSITAICVLQAIADGFQYGFDVIDQTGLPSGTVYPALRRMEAGSLIVSKWEAPAVAQREQRPARKYYELTRSGQLALAEAASRYRLNERAAPRVGKPSTARR